MIAPVTARPTTPQRISEKALKVAPAAVMLPVPKTR